MLSNRTRQDMFRIIRRLYLARIDADYVPGITVDRASALNVYFQALDVFRYLGIKA